MKNKYSLPYEVKEPIPCIDCITLPMCKSKVLSSRDPNDQQMNLIAIILAKCSIAHDYVYEKHPENDSANMLTPISYIKMHMILNYLKGQGGYVKPPKGRKLTEFFKNMCLSTIKNSKWKK